MRTCAHLNGEGVSVNECVCVCVWLKTFVIMYFICMLQSQASLRLMMLNKGAVKLLQTFVGQLPHQDLHRGLPAHFTDLAELVRQVTLLSAGAPLHKDKVKDTTLSPVEKDLIAMVDQVEVGVTQLVNDVFTLCQSL